MRLTIPQAVPMRGLLTQRRRRQINSAGMIVLYLLPSLALFALFVVFPVVQAAHYSLYRWNGLTTLDDYIGLKNYRTLFNDPIFLTAVKNNLLIAVLSLLIQLPAALVLALLLNQKVPGRTFFRTVFFLPYVLSEVVTGLIWSFIYNPSNGLIAGLLHQFNPSAVPPAWLGDTHTVLFAIFAAMCWKYIGFHFVLYVAGLQQIPAEVVEAARIDGANSWQIARHVTIPLLGSTIRLSVFLSILGSLQYFDLIYVMSGGRSGECQRNDGHLSDSLRPARVRVGVWQRGGRGDVCPVPDLRVVLSAGHHATRSERELGAVRRPREEAKR